MILENAFSVAAPMERVYDALTDGAMVVPSLPGARRSPKSDEQNTTKGELRITLGSTTIPYRGTVRLDEADRDAGALALTIDAREGRGRGVLHASVSIRLRESHGATTVSLRTEVDVDGRAAKVTSGEFHSAVQDLLAEFGKNIQATMNGVALTTNGQKEAPAQGELLAGAAEPIAAPPVPTTAPAEPAVRGSVHIMTSEPINAAEVQPPAGPLGVLRDQLRRRPWLAPLLLLAGLTLVLLVRRRRR